MFDESKGTGNGYDTAYVDTNRNRDLSGEKPLRWTAKSSSVTPWLSVRARQGKGPDSRGNQIEVRWRLYSGTRDRVERRGAWRGKLDSTNGKIDVILLDSNCNGLYDDGFSCGDPNALNWQEYKWGDCAYADTNGCGTAVASEWSRHCLPQNAITNLDGSLYTLEATKSGSSMTVARADVPTGTLMLRAKNINGFSGPANAMNMIGKSGIYHFEKLDGSPIRLPVGNYLFGSGGFEFKTAESKPFKVGGLVERIIEIEQDRQTTVEIEGDAVLEVMPDQREVVLVPGQNAGIDWKIKIGDDISDVGFGFELDPKGITARFDGSEQRIQPKECPGGG